MCYKESPSTIYSTKIVSLSELFFCKDDESQNYVIPEYQRPYAWEEKHWEDLWNDLQRAYSKKGEYLLGSVYLNENGEILDGQQRFTTLYIFLKCFGFKKNELCDIELGENDNEFFEKIKKSNDIKDIGEPQTASQKRLKGCYEFFKNDKKCKNEKIKMLKLEMEKSKKDNDFKDFVKNKVFLIKTTIDDKDKTHSIVTFITQTDRGKRLSNLEKIKSNLYYAAYTLFDDKKKLEQIQYDIKNVFGECYKHINTLYDKPEKGERMIVEALYGLLRYVKINPQKANEKLFSDISNIINDEIYEKFIIKDIWLLEGEDTITTRINNALSAPNNENFFNVVLGLLRQIEQFLSEYKLTKRDENEIFHNELNLNRYILVAMILGEYENKNTSKQELDSEKLIEKLAERKIDIEQWQNNTKEFDGIEQKIQINSLAKWDKRLIEQSHFSVFSAGKSPYSTFLQKPISITQDYKYDKLYIFDSIVWGNYRYILLAYEEFYRSKHNNLSKFNYMKVAQDKIEREHLFAKNLEDVVISEAKEYLNIQADKRDYSVWIWDIGNILLLPKYENISIGKDSPLKKSKKIIDEFIPKEYGNDEKNFPFQSTLAFLKKIKECQGDIKKMMKLCNERTEELKCFVWHRF